jgi:YfiR/HmsC-like
MKEVKTIMMNQTKPKTKTKRQDFEKGPRARVHSMPVFILVLALLMQAPTMASNDTDNTQDLIRAAMVYNFCKFVEWPEAEEPEHLVLGVMSDGFSTPDFSSIDGKTVRDLQLEVRVISSRSDLAECNLLFISEAQGMTLQDAFAESKSESILTISEIDGFCTKGGIIQMVPRRGKMRFFINRKAADESGLTLSSQLLKMARIVEGD